MVAGALAEGVGLLTLLPLLSSAGGGKADRVAALIPAAIDPFIAMLILFVTIMIARALILLARDRATARLENGYDVSLRLRAATTLAARGWPFAAGIGQAGMQTLLANDVPSYIASCRAVAAVDWLDALPGITCPAHVIAGAHDAGATPAMAAEIRQRVPGATIEVLPDASHLGPIETPAAFMASLGGFLRTIS